MKTRLTGIITVILILTLSTAMTASAEVTAELQILDTGTDGTGEWTSNPSGTYPAGTTVAARYILKTDSEDTDATFNGFKVSLPADTEEARYIITENDDKYQPQNDFSYVINPNLEKPLAVGFIFGENDPSASGADILHFDIEILKESESKTIPVSAEVKYVKTGYDAYLINGESVSVNIKQKSETTPTSEPTQNPTHQPTSAPSGPSGPASSGGSYNPEPEKSIYLPSTPEPSEPFSEQTAEPQRTPEASVIIQTPKPVSSPASPGFGFIPVLFGIGLLSLTRRHKN